MLIAVLQRWARSARPRWQVVALPLFLNIGCAWLPKPPAEAPWAAREGLAPIAERTQEERQAGGVSYHHVHLVHEDGKHTYLLRLGNGQVVGPLTRDPVVSVAHGKTPLVAVRPAGPDAGYLLVDVSTGALTPTRTSLAKKQSNEMVVLTAPTDWAERDAAVLGVSGVVWHAQDLLPGAEVTFESAVKATAMVATRGGLRVFDDEGNALSSQPTTCPARFIWTGKTWRIAHNCPEGTSVMSKTGESFWAGRDGLVFQGTLAAKAHHFTDPKGGHHLLPLDLQGPGTTLPGAPMAAGKRMWAVPLARAAGAPADYALLDPKTLAMSSPPVLVRPLTDRCQGTPERAMHLRAWCFGTDAAAAPRDRGVFVQSATPAGPRWGLVEPWGRVLRGPVWTDVRVVPIDIDSKGLANRSTRLTRSLFLVQDPATGRWIRIEPNGTPEMDAAPHASPEEAAAQALSEVTAFHRAWSQDPEAGARDRRHRDMRQYAEWTLNQDVHWSFQRAGQLASIVGADIDPRYDEDGLIRAAMRKICTSHKTFSAHQFSNLRKAANVLETYYDGAPGPLSKDLASLHEEAVAKVEAREKEAREAVLERIRKGIGWQEPSPAPAYTPSYSPSASVGCSWCSGVIAQQRDIQNREFQRWVDSVDAVVRRYR